MKWREIRRKKKNTHNFWNGLRLPLSNDNFIQFNYKKKHTKLRHKLKENSVTNWIKISPIKRTPWNVLHFQLNKSPKNWTTKSKQSVGWITLQFDLALVIFLSNPVLYKQSISFFSFFSSSLISIWFVCLSVYYVRLSVCMRIFVFVFYVCVWVCQSIGHLNMSKMWLWCRKLADASALQNKTKTAAYFISMIHSVLLQRVIWRVWIFRCILSLTATDLQHIVRFWLIGCLLAFFFC